MATPARGIGAGHMVYIGEGIQEGQALIIIVI
jgi:hypothetical protein